MMPVSMNLSSERKQNMKSLLAAISLALALVSPAFAGIEWGFPDSALSVMGTPVLGSGSGTATIALGNFATGWHDGTSRPLKNG